TGVDDGQATATLTVVDRVFRTATSTATIEVRNVAPSVSIAPVGTLIAGVAHRLVGSFTDPGIMDTHQFHWDFGDGATASGSLEVDHAWEQNGVYTVTLTVTDDDGGVGTQTARVVVGCDGGCMQPAPTPTPGPIPGPISSPTPTPIPAPAPVPAPVLVCDLDADGDVDAAD
ncbi:MAG: PKD domain-containing protein, partial [Myxococcales bacterium]|nr:PKD domain-containing protein [Myxococcales bacterium]